MMDTTSMKTLDIRFICVVQGLARCVPRLCWGGEQYEENHIFKPGHSLANNTHTHTVSPAVRIMRMLFEYSHDSTYYI